MLIRVIEDDQGRALRICENLKKAVDFLDCNNIFSDVIPEYTDWHLIKDKICGSEEYWLIDIQYDSFISSESQEFFNQLKNDFSDDWKSIIDNILSDHKDFYGILLVPLAIKNGIKFSFCSNNEAIIRDAYNDFVNKIINYQKSHIIDKPKIINKSETDYHVEILNHILTFHSRNNLTNFTKNEWRKLRGDGVSLIQRLKTIGNNKITNRINNGCTFRVHHLKDYKDWVLTEDLYDKEIVPIILNNIPKQEEIFLNLYDIPYYKTASSFSNKIKQWTTPPLKALFQDNNKKTNYFEEIVKLSLYEFDNRVTFIEPNGLIINKDSNIPKIKDAFFVISTPVKMQLKADHMLHLWFNLPGLMTCLLYDFGFAKNTILPGIDWLKGDYQETKIRLTLIGGKDAKDNFCSILELDQQFLLFDGLTVMIFLKEPQKYYSNIFCTIGQDSYKLCEKLIDLGAEWIVYTNRLQKKDKNYLSTIVVPTQNGSVKKYENYKFIWKSITPPIIAFNIAAENSISIFDTTKVVPLVKEKQIVYSNKIFNKINIHLLSILNEMDING